MEIKRILWPTDFSDEALEALPYVTSLAEKYGAQVIMLHVQEELERLAHLSEGVNFEYAEKLRENLTRNKDRLFEELCEKLGENCADYEKLMLTGDAAVRILETIDKKRIDLVVMATHGYGALRRFAYGNVANKVTHHSPVPVLTVRIKKKR